MSYSFSDYPNRDEWLKARAGGIGGSDASAMCGVSPWKSQNELWRVKTGLEREFQGNADTERGTALEPVVRERFLSLFPQFDLEYHPYGMYRNDDEKRLFSTLDGILIAKDDYHVENTALGVSFFIKKGERFVLEIKNPSPRDRKSYEALNTIPLHYKYQAVMEMFTSGVDKQIMFVNITGRLASTPHDERMFITDIHSNESQRILSDIRTTLPFFWEHVEKKEPIPECIEIGDDMENSLIVLKGEPVVGSFKTNFEEVKKDVSLYAERYKGLVFTPSEKGKAKEVRATLNKAIDSIESTRKSAKKVYEEPLKEFESKCKELTDILISVKTPVEEQIKTIEDGEKQHKADLIYDLMDRVLSDYPTVKDILKKSGNVEFNPKWTNTTYSLDEVEKDLREICDSILQDWNVISLETEEVQNIYLTNGRNLQDAFLQKNRLESLRSQKRAEEGKDGLIIKRLEIAHKDKGEFIKLISYMKEHGFSCKEI